MQQESPSANGNGKVNGIVGLKGMYEDYFLDYASYVILDRAVPAVKDGLKPVQRRILHALWEMNDGRFHKVANVIGQTMQYHPHGDAAIGDALVNLGQRNLLVDTQGNWGDFRTGDSAAAARYIEARLTKFALEVLFNPQTTEWQLSYDGRKKEPIALPAKFPLVLAQGVEGIAVGLATRILPHNFVELLQASIKILEGKRVKIYPDFPTGGQLDVSDYQNGKRGGRVKVRAGVEALDKSTLVIRELPYGVTTTNLIDSIIKANDKGKIKIKKVVDNTAAEVEIQVDLAPGYSPEVAIDALYKFTNCGVSISPNACIIIDDKPHFVTVEDILRICTEQTKELLRRELEIRKHELEEKIHFASLEKIFIQKRIYRDIEDCETWEAVLETIDAGLRKYVRVPGEAADDRLELLRDITEQDLVRLTEIRIKRISKYNTFKAEEQMVQLQEELQQVKHDLDHLVEYTIAWFQHLLDKYGKGRERRTRITTFEEIQATEVVAANAKLFVNRKEGFIGYGLKKDEFVTDCSDIDDVIVFRKDGKFKVSRIADKVFMGKNILHVAVWKKGDERTTYNMIYLDGKTGRSYAKRFNVSAVTRDREYDLTTGEKNTKVLYLSANPNGEAEVVDVFLTSSARARKKEFEFDFGELDIKGRRSKGNTVTKYPVRKVELKEVGKSTLGAIKVWMDEVSGRLNTDERGIYLGAFDTGDQILVIYRDGTYEMNELDLNKRYPADQLVFISHYDPLDAVSAVYYEGEKGRTVVKRFLVETSTLDQRFPFITEHKDSKLYFATTDSDPEVEYAFMANRKKQTRQVNLADFIDVKGWKAIGNKLEDAKLISISAIEKKKKDGKKQREVASEADDKLHAGDQIDFDL